MTAATKPAPRKRAAKKPGTVLVLRSCDKDLRSHGGFKWPESGAVSCPDWNPRPECGNGLHGLLWGEGDGGLMNWSEDARWLVVEVDASLIVDLAGKVKFPAGTVVFCGDRIEAAAFVSANPGAAGRAVVSGTATAGFRGTATAGDSGTATAGDSGTATAGDSGVLVIHHYSAKLNRYTLKVAEVGENGIEANVPYRLDADGRFVKAAA